MRRALLCLVLAALLCGCAGVSGAPAEGDGKLSVVATVFPLYDWTRNLLGASEDVELTLLLDGGVDMHSFQPGVDDLMRVASCDLLIYVGGESDDWIADALAASTKPRQRALNLLELLDAAALTEELREGMQGEAEDTPDEHIWLSPRRAALLCRSIAAALSELDPAGAAAYEQTCASYLEALGELEADCAALARLAAEAEVRPCLVVADRFPFRYLTEDCGLDYYAAFPGCSAETGASFETVRFLARKLDERGGGLLFTTENPIPGVAETVARTAQTEDVQLLTLDSMQSVTHADVEGGETYLAVMRRNLDALTEAFGTKEQVWH
ncbi:MAG: metal ABC transporter substrate-binding protein [Oscillospiraceae bacterium]|nr:metal ABC transporter substrate-binding protein [Oscillospiraceae bacterium]